MGATTTRATALLKQFSTTSTTAHVSTILYPRLSSRFCFQRRKLFLPLQSKRPISSSSSSSSRTIISSSSNGGLPQGEKPKSSVPDFCLYNTMTKQKDVFRPRVPGKVGMYVCGVTTYDLSHIGHARVYVTFDVLYRYLKHLEYEVRYVRNFTDVDDKIIARANDLGEDPLSLSSRFCDEFYKDMVHLNCLSPSVEPRVSSHMSQIIDMIKQIIDNGCAYEIGGDVYFSVDKFPAYGRLSGRKLEDNRAGERVAVDSRKHNPADFALWKSVKPGEPYWDSPWGPGRPGWHIECSAMSSAYLGHSFDIHGGGMDLIFPHHENEIAQSCAACSHSSINYWVHNGFVTIDSEKMSKSLGNFFTIRQVIDLYHPLALRLFLIGTHYRSPINYSDIQLESASDRLFYIYQGKKQALRVESLLSLEKEIRNVLDVLGLMSSCYSEVISFSANDVLCLAAIKYSDMQILKQLREKALRRAGVTEEHILQKIEERTMARENKNYKRSDEIRKELASVGIALMDGQDGTTWRPTLPLELQEQLSSA